MKITIARQCGSGGHKVADILSEKLGMEIFDKKRFIEESKRRNVYDENANFLNEKPIDSFLYSLVMSYGSKNPRERYIRFVKDVTEQESLSLIHILPSAYSIRSLKSFMPFIEKLLLIAS